MKNPFKISRLTSVPLTDVWKHEADDFTPWLALEENLELLSEELGFKMILEATEQKVGSFYADIVCKNAADNSIVLIENQIRPTDHKHLGQICTYAAMIKASKVIWVSERIRDEHREAIEWLNQISNDETSFYAVQVKAFKIDDSPPAPTFEILARPQLLSRQIRSEVKRVSNSDLNDTQLRWQEYWTNFLKIAEKKIQSSSSRTPYKGNWQTVGSRSGLLGGYIEYNVYASGKNIRAEAYIGSVDAKIIFHALKMHIAKIESDFGGALTWEENPSKQDCRIAIYMKGQSVDFEEPQRGVHHEWLADSMSKLMDAVKPFEDHLDFDAAAKKIENDMDVEQ